MVWVYSFWYFIKILTIVKIISNKTRLTKEFNRRGVIAINEKIFLFTLAHIKYVKLKKVKVTKIANKRALKIYAFKCEILGTKVTNKIAFKIQKLSIKMNAGTDIASKLEKKDFSSTNWFRIH